MTRKQYEQWPEIKEDLRKWAEYNNAELYQLQPVVTGKIKTAGSDVTRRDDSELITAHAKRAGADKPLLKAGLRLGRST